MPLFYLIISIVIFGAWGVVSREIPLPSSALVLLMSISGGLFSWVLIRQRTSVFPIPRSSILVGINLAADLLLLVYAFRQLPLSVVITIHYLGPLFVQFLAPLILKEKVLPRSIIFATIGLLGGYLVAAPDVLFDSVDKILGGLAALGSAFTLSGNILLQKRRMDRSSSPAVAVTQYNIVLAICMAISLIFSVAVDSEFNLQLRGSLNHSLLFAVLAGMAVQGAAMVMFNKAIKTMTASIVSIITISEIAFSTIFGSIIYGERISSLQTFGIFLVASAVIAVRPTPGEHNVG